MVASGKILRSLIAVTAIAAVIFFIYAERDAIPWLNLQPSYVFEIVVFVVAAWVSTAFSQLVLLRSLNVNLPFAELLAVHVAAGLLNHLPLRPGLLFRGHYLKRHGDLSYAHFASFTLVGSLLTALVGLLMAVTTYAAIPTRPAGGGVALAFVIMLLAAITLALLNPKVSMPFWNGLGAVPRLWNDVMSGRRMLAQRPRVIVAALIATIAAFLFSAMRYAGAFALFGIDLPWTHLVVLGVVSQLALFTAVTPAALGVHELFVGLAGVAIGVSAPMGLAAAAATRIVMLACYLVFGGASVLWLSHRDGFVAGKE